MARCREYIQNVTTITKVVRISDNGKASQIPFTPIMQVMPWSTEPEKQVRARQQMWWPALLVPCSDNIR